MIQIYPIDVQIQVPENEFKITKYKNPDVDDQMSGTCGWFEPLDSPWNVIFSCVLAQYFISFLFEHPVGWVFDESSGIIRMEGEASM